MFLLLAGMQATAPLIEQPLEHFERVLDTNCTGVVRMLQAVAPAMVRQVRAFIGIFLSMSLYTWALYMRLQPSACAS